MRQNDIAKLGKKLMADFDKVVGYEGHLSEKGEFVLFVADKLSSAEQKQLQQEVDQFDQHLTCKIIVTGEFKPF